MKVHHVVADSTHFSQSLDAFHAVQMKIEPVPVLGVSSKRMYSPKVRLATFSKKTKKRRETLSTDYADFADSLRTQIVISIPVRRVVFEAGTSKWKKTTSSINSDESAIGESGQADQLDTKGFSDKGAANPLECRRISDSLRQALSRGT